MNRVDRHLQDAFDAGGLGGLTDGQLLGRFVARREKVVFEAIVLRHGSMVWGVCRRVLRDHHDAEDAFQAAFLVLARRAATIGTPERLGNWLYGVAYQTSRKARAMRTKRRSREGQASHTPEPEAAGVEQPDDRRDELDRELSRLPEKYRVPIVLCGLEGMTHQEAAERLGWPVGTVSGRLSRAKAMLARRLSRRDVPESGVSLAVLLARESASASFPTYLIVPTARAAGLIAAGGAATAGMVSAEVAALTEEVVKMMLWSKLKLAAAVILSSPAIIVGVIRPDDGPREGSPPQVKAVRAPVGQAAAGKAGEPPERKALRDRGIVNMKTIALALHDSHLEHGSFPPAVLRKGEGQPSYSWRVAILPYMGRGGTDLYARYRFDEPWDGPNNSKLLPQIPSAFHLPEAGQDATHASYFALIGRGAVFSDDKGTKIDEVRDGASTTILFVEWKRPVPWTKPEDIPLVEGEPLPKVGGYFETCALMGGFQAAFVDGTIKLMSGTMKDSAIRPFITKSGGEKIEIE